MDTLDDAHNVLVLGPAGTPAVDRAIGELVSHAVPGPRNLAYVTLARSPDEWFEAVFGNADDEPLRRIGAVGSGDPVRAEAVAERGGREPGDTEVEMVADPGDLPRLGITVSEFFTRWGGDSVPTVLCFDSVTALVQYVDLQPAYRFFHTLGGRVEWSAGLGL
jgi:hypothetical protein